MIFTLKVCLLLSLVLTSALSIQLWAFRKVPLSRMLFINMILYSLWSLWVMLTLLAPDLETKIFFTKIRQMTNPYLVPIWIVIASMIFYRSFWDRFRKWVPILFIIPLITSIISFSSLFQTQLDPLLNHHFELLPQGEGLLTYKVGPLLNINFLYQGIFLLVLYAIYIYNLFSPKKHLRQYAILFLIGGLVPVAMEVLFRYISTERYLIQLGAATSWVLALATYFGVTRLEFLNIKSYARDRILKLLPNPVLTITPRMELWDTNFAARELFQINKEDLGKDIRGAEKFHFMLSENPHLEINGTTFQIFRHEIDTHNFQEKAFVFVLNDVTQISELNQDLAESNMTLKELNDRILKMTNFNKKIHTVLSHDMTGVLGTIHGLSHLDPESKVMNLIHKASASSLDLLRNILSWSHEENHKKPVNIVKCLEKVASQLSTQVAEKEIQINLPIDRSPLFIHGSTHMLEAIHRNIITNAIKYGPRKSIVQIFLLQHQDTVEIHISDSGHGMDEEDIENVLNFRPTKNNSEKGYGVGLRFTLEFVQHLKGNLRIESKVGTGTTVKLQFPKVSHPVVL